MSPEPYRIWEYYNQKCNLAQAYDIAINDKGIRDLPRPNLRLSKEELLLARKMIAEVKEKTGKLTKYIIEIKPKKQTNPPNEKNKKTAAYRNAALTYAKNYAKWSAAREYCEDRQMNFLILTEDHLGV